ncbi:MAG: PspC domain-containing protein [Alistipes sp.]|nr:PspC domain-containing protein [Alistipes senegalensis]MCM1251155.1 PspC domain-containing protein [Alistipes sp.]
MTNDKKRLCRTRNGVIAGVCGGLAEYFGLDATLLRIATAILILFGGLSLWVYILLWILVPKEPKQIKA